MNIPTAFEAGKKGSITKTITLEDVESFAKISGDDQPVHISPDYASNTRFGGQIVHGAILIGLISAISIFFILDRGFYTNVLILFLLAYFLLRKEFQIVTLIFLIPKVISIVTAVLKLNCSNPLP